MNELERLKKQKYLLWIPILGASWFFIKLSMINKKYRFISINKFIISYALRTFLELMGFMIIVLIIFKLINITNLIIAYILLFLWWNYLFVLGSLKLLKKTDQMAHIKNEKKD